MLQHDPTLTPDTVKARMMKTRGKGIRAIVGDTINWGHGHFSQYDVFTIGAGYLDVHAALGNHDVALGGAASPVATFNPAPAGNTVNGTSLSGVTALFGVAPPFGLIPLFGVPALSMIR